MTDERPRLGEFFTLAEMMITSTGLPNIPDARARANLQVLVETVLDPLRRHLRRPVRVRSGYRSNQVNHAVGGSKTSRHKTGEAADIKVDELGSIGLLEAILLCDVDFDQIIAYHPLRGGHVHVGIIAGAAARHRKQVLLAPAGGGYTLWVAGGAAPW